MRVAVLCDVHGNLPALEAVLADVRMVGVDAIVCGGDVAAGPFPSESLQLLREAGALFVRGNADAPSPKAPPGYWDWVAAKLRDEAVAFLAAQPISRALGEVLYCHGSPRDEDEILTRVSADERFRRALAGVRQPVVVGGHTHVQFTRVVDGTVFVNAGSVGMPYEGRPGAFWALAEGEAVEHRHTSYDVEAAVARACTTSYPLLDDFQSTLLDPPDPAAVSEFFERAATGAG